MRVNHKRIKYAILILILLVVTTISGIYAYTSYEIATVENNVVSGAVNIELKEYIEDSNGQQVEVDTVDEHVLPSENIPFTVRINNKGIKAYLRIKYEYINAIFNINDINMDDTNWVKKGDYYYYKNVLNEGEIVELFNGYTIPNNIEGEYNFIITAEAIQSEHFDVNFESDTPWGNIVIEDSIDDDYDISTINVASNTVVDYKDDSRKFIDIPADFMKNISLLKPGDEISDYIIIKNVSDKEIEIFMKNVNLSSVLNTNYRYLNLKVYDEINGLVYDGSILQDTMTSLGKFKPGNSKRLKFVVNFLVENENVTSIKDYKIGWKFYLNEIEEEKGIIDIINPHTGDGIIFWVIIFIISLCLLALTIKRFILAKKY